MSKGEQTDEPRPLAPEVFRAQLMDEIRHVARRAFGLVGLPVLLEEFRAATFEEAFRRRNEDGMTAQAAAAGADISRQGMAKLGRTVKHLSRDPSRWSASMGLYYYAQTHGRKGVKKGELARYFYDELKQPASREFEPYLRVLMDLGEVVERDDVIIAADPWEDVSVEVRRFLEVQIMQTRDEGITIGELAKRYYDQFPKSVRKDTWFEDALESLRLDGHIDISDGRAWARSATVDLRRNEGATRTTVRSILGFVHKVAATVEDNDGSRTHCMFRLGFRVPDDDEAAAAELDAVVAGILEVISEADERVGASDSASRTATLAIAGASGPD